jgi:hypothetical protein
MSIPVFRPETSEDLGSIWVVGVLLDDYSALLQRLDNRKRPTSRVFPPLTRRRIVPAQS